MMVKTTMIRDSSFIARRNAGKHSYFTADSLRELFPIPVVLLFVFTGILLVGWSFAVPIYESPDEPSHWQVAEYIHDHLQLPPYNVYFVEGNQPPAYYS